MPTIVFDLDGTLVDSVHDLVPALNRTLAEQNLPPFSLDDFARLSGSGGLRAMIAYAFRANERPLSRVHHQELFKATVADYDQNIAVHSQKYPGVPKALNALRRVGWLCAVCTNKPIAQAEKLLQELKLDVYLAAITGGDSFDVRKPDPRHLIETIELAGGTRATMPSWWAIQRRI